MTWVESGTIEDIENLHNMDRPRALAAMILLAEIVLVYWVSAALTLPSPGGLAGGQIPTRLVSMAAIVVWPDVQPAALSSELETAKTEDLDEKAGTGGDDSDPTAKTSGDSDGSGVPDDIRIVSISPSAMIPLWVGDVVSFEVSVEYNLTSASSSPLSMLIEECSCDAPLPLGLSIGDPGHFQVRSAATAGKGRRMQTFTTKKIRVPVAELLSITVKLGDESAAARPTDKKLFKVADAGRPATGTQNSVRIVSVRPASGTLVRGGDNIEFEVMVDYNLPGEAAILGLKIDNGSASIFEASEPVKRGQRRMVFRERVRIPDNVSAPETKVAVTVRLGQAESRETIDLKIATR